MVLLRSQRPFYLVGRVSEACTEDFYSTFVQKRRSTSSDLNILGSPTKLDSLNS
jgi:hypothetical protein